MLAWLRSIVGSKPVSDRRKYARYEVPAPLEVKAGGGVHFCRVDNVSAGGVRLTPAFEADRDARVTVTDPASGLALDGHVVGSDVDGVRVKFDSEDAGLVVSAWLRISNEEAEARSDATP